MDTLYFYELALQIIYLFYLPFYKLVNGYLTGLKSNNLYQMNFTKFCKGDS